MKGKVAVTLAVLALGCAPAFGIYTSIQHQLVDGVGDTTFDPNTGLFQVNAVDNNALTLNDGGVLAGTIDNATISLQTYFNQILPGPVAQFTGGTLSLTFDYDGTPYEISGPITGMLFDVTPGQFQSTIDGVGRWTATTKNLPGSGDWPDGGGFSSIDSLTVAFGQHLSSFDWESELSGWVETSYSLFPDDSAIPEPATLALLAFGALALARRRS